MCAFRPHQRMARHISMSAGGWWASVQPRRPSRLSAHRLSLSASAPSFSITHLSKLYYFCPALPPFQRLANVFSSPREPASELALAGEINRWLCRTERSPTLAGQPTDTLILLITSALGQLHRPPTHNLQTANNNNLYV